MAKSRAQRKAEQRAREAEQRRQQGGGGNGAEPAAESHAQHDTQVPISGDVAEFDAAIETGQPPPDDVPSRAAVRGATAEPPQPAPPPPAPSRADTPEPAAPAKKSRRELRAERKAQ